MKLFKSIFTVETKRLFIRRNLLFSFVFLLILVIFIQDGKNYLNSIQKNKKMFQETEKKRISQYMLYTQYATYGFRLMFHPPVQSILFHSSSVTNGLMANIDNTERLNIFNVAKGESLFMEKSGGFLDFSGIIFLIGCLLYSLYGFGTFRNIEYLKFIAKVSGHKNIFFLVLISRIILLNLVFLLLVCLSIVWMLVIGIKIINIFFLWYILLAVLVLTFFFMIGVLIGTRKTQLIASITLVLVCFLFIFLFPWAVNKTVNVNAAFIRSNFKLELENLKLMMDFERRVYNQIGIYKSGNIATDDVKQLVKGLLNNEFKRFKKNENELKNDTSNNIKIYQTIASLFPTSFYLSVNRELGGIGYEGFLKFYNYSHELKYKFIDFYSRKKFFEKSEPGIVEPFIKNEEGYVFYGKSQLPDNYWFGVLLTLFYILLLYMILFKILSKRFKTIEYKEPGIEFQEGQNSAFVLCKDKKLKDDIFRYYEQKEDAVCLEKINTKDFQFDGIDPEDTFNFFCKISGVDKEKAVENLTLLGIIDLKKESHQHETILKIYTAIKTAADRKFIVLNDFLKKESRTFEEDFFKLIVSLEEMGKKILYLSCEMYFPKISLNEKIHVENFTTLPFNVNEITLR